MSPPNLQPQPLLPLSSAKSWAKSLADVSGFGLSKSLASLVWHMSSVWSPGPKSPGHRRSCSPSRLCNPPMKPHLHTVLFPDSIFCWDQDVIWSSEHGWCYWYIFLNLRHLDLRPFFWSCFCSRSEGPTKCSVPIYKQCSSSVVRPGSSYLSF